MATAAQHYAQHLAPIYVWMAGGAQAALQAGAAEIDALDLGLRAGARAVDLGAGFGMHAIPLARRGLAVTAVDSSAELLATLEVLRGDLPVSAVRDDLLAFERHLDRAPDLVLCMGDTLAHLPAKDDVDALFAAVHRALAPGGAFVLSLRDQTVPLVADQRFLTVRSDESRILTCFLEYESETVVVHDLVHERAENGWNLRVSHYRKLRLAPARLVERLAALGLRVRQEPGVRGLMRIVACKD